MIPTDAENLEQLLLRRLCVEVRHALHGVMGSLELLSGEPLSPAQSEQLANGRESARELLRTTAEVSELAEAAFPEQPCVFGFRGLLSDFADLIEIRAARRNLTVRWSVDPQVPHFVRGHRRTIENVLYRLVDNSLKFTDSGGIVLAVKPKVLDHRACQVIIEVADTGRGIDHSVLPAGKRLVADAQTGGLGWRLARKQLAEIGGELEVISSDSRGTTIAATLWVSISSTAHGAADPGHPERLVPLHLLVAEDSDDSFYLFENFIRDEGHRISRAMNGADALELFKNADYDMVVMDVNMPVMDGYTASRAIREWETQQRLRRRPILLFSADDPGRQMRLGAAAGCSGYLAKPATKDELLWALDLYASR